MKIIVCFRLNYLCLCVVKLTIKIPSWLVHIIATYHAYQFIIFDKAAAHILQVGMVCKSKSREGVTKSPSEVPDEFDITFQEHFLLSRLPQKMYKNKIM